MVLLTLRIGRFIVAGVNVGIKVRGSDDRAHLP